MNLLIIPHLVIVFVLKGIAAYVRGGWFLLWHPIRFIAFIEEFAKFEERIADADDIRASGFNDYNRRQRRALGARGGR